MMYLRNKDRKKNVQLTANSKQFTRIFTLHLKTDPIGITVIFCRRIIQNTRKKQRTKAFLGERSGGLGEICIFFSFSKSITFTNDDFIKKIKKRKFKHALHKSCLFL